MTNAVALRAVLDTNVIVAALKSKNPKSPTIELLDRWSAGEFKLIYCDDLLVEYQEKLIDRNVPLESRATFLETLIRLGGWHKLSPEQIMPVVSEDPDDDMVVACAIVGRATHLVTYDLHLLNLGPTYQGINILDGLHFLYAVRGDTVS